MTRVSAAVTFRVPLPYRELSPNEKCHWRKKARFVEAYREIVGWESWMVKRRIDYVQPAKARVSLVFCTKGAKGNGYQPRDEDNAVASFKAGFDGLRATGWFKDDSRQYMEMGPVKIDSSRGPYVEVTIEPCA